MKKSIKTTCSEHPVDRGITIKCDQNFQHPPHKVFIVGSGMEQQAVIEAMKSTMNDNPQIYNRNKPNFIQIEKTEEGITTRLLSEEEMEALTTPKKCRDTIRMKRILVPTVSDLSDPFPSPKQMKALAKAGRKAGRSMKELLESIAKSNKAFINQTNHKSKFHN